MREFVFILLLLGCAFSLQKTIPPNSGRVCGFGDFNNDRYTDIIVQRGKNLTILFYNDNLINVLEEGIFTNASTFEVGNEIVECSLGDFNGDATLDILVSEKISENEYKHTLWLAKNEFPFDTFEKHEMAILQSQAMTIDVDGDGIYDALGFYPNGSLYCRRYDYGILPIQFSDCSNLFKNLGDFKLYPGLPHLYTDIITGELYSELILMGIENGNLKMHTFRRIKDNIWSKTKQQIPVLEAKFIGAPVPGDFNADKKIEILVPVCQEEECEHISHFAIWQRDIGWRNVTLDMSGFSIVQEKDTKVIFRVGDFNLDGYPDLVSTMRDGKSGVPAAKIVENLPCQHCEGNDTRKFEVRKSSFIQPKEVSLGVITMSSFFDLKEDGSLDILVEYSYGKETKFTFIPCDDKGDTTFLKVQVFTNCLDVSKCETSGKQPGTGISWGGSCMYFTMSDGWGGSLQSVACQQPAQTHRSLMAPYVLFGLGRSPNFVDELVVGAPRYADNIKSPSRLHTLKQIVPNSRIIMMPPILGGTAWTSRLYVTPSSLIVQSIIVISVVCIILLLVVTLLHLRERKEDRVERQQQSHRFHFDAM